MGSQFKVLITTRQSTSSSYRSLPLGELSPDAALELLAELLGKQEVEQELDFAKKICQKAKYIPIALYHIAAAFSRKPGGVLC